jgi:hypothetical protein
MNERELKEFIETKYHDYMNTRRIPDGEPNKRGRRDKYKLYFMIDQNLGEAFEGYVRYANYATKKEAIIHFIRIGLVNEGRIDLYADTQEKVDSMLIKQVREEIQKAGEGRESN